jgi:hypothetical protein
MLIAVSPDNRGAEPSRTGPVPLRSARQLLMACPRWTRLRFKKKSRRDRLLTMMEYPLPCLQAAPSGTPMRGGDHAEEPYPRLQATRGILEMIAQTPPPLTTSAGSTMLHCDAPQAAESAPGHEQAC